MTRRHLLATPAVTAAPAPGFFTLRRQQDRWWLMDPRGRRFWSLALNHIDSAPLRESDSGSLWNSSFSNSSEKWIREAVRPDLLRWGFNSVGWVQEVVTINDQNHRHSRSFTPEEYRWLDLPYCHLLPVIESHQWEIETRLPDLRSKGWAEWVDYVVRDQCARLKEDRNLIGYFYTDCPTWVHARKENAWKAPLFDPEKLKSAAGRAELFELATIYYRTLAEAVKRYDPHHLILGDRYELQAALPEEVVKAALPYVDVLSFQCFAPPPVIEEKMKHWAVLSGKPVLLADSAQQVRVGSSGVRDHSVDGHRAVLERLRAMPECVGYHLCGAYLKNNARKRGFRDHRNAEAAYVAGLAQANRETLAWLSRL